MVIFRKREGVSDIKQPEKVSRENSVYRGQ